MDLKFEVGDKVRVIRNEWGDEDEGVTVGNIHVVSLFYSGNCGEESNENGYYLEGIGVVLLESQLELVEEDGPANAHHHKITLDDKEYEFTHKQLKELKLIIEGVLA